MKVLKQTLIVIVILVGVALAYIAFMDGNYRVERSREIKAPAALVYHTVNTYKTWGEWSPWLGMDPNAVITYDGPDQGVGSKYHWKGNEDVGEGQMETVFAAVNDSLAQKIYFMAPFESESDIYWSFKETEGGVEVLWGMAGELPWPWKFMADGMDENIGRDYEKGLALLDSVVNVYMNKTSVEIGEVMEQPAHNCLAIAAECSFDEMSAMIETNMPKLGMYVHNQKIEMQGMPMNIIKKWDEENKRTEFMVAIPTPKDAPVADDIINIQTDPGNFLKVTFKGQYEKSDEAWNAAMAHMEEKEMIWDEERSPYSIYANDPGDFPNPADWITEIYIPVKM